MTNVGEVKPLSWNNAWQKAEIADNAEMYIHKHERRYLWTQFCVPALHGCASERCISQLVK